MHILSKRVSLNCDPFSEPGETMNGKWKANPVEACDSMTNNRTMLKQKIAHKTDRAGNCYVPKAEYINPFIESVYALFSTMLDCEVHRQDLALRRNLDPSLDIVAFISLSGSVQGTVALAFPIKTALSIVSRIYEDEVVVIDSKVIDAIGEMANVVAGSAQAFLCQVEQGRIDLGVPTVVRGSNFSIDYPSQATWLEVPFSSELGVFVIRVTIKKGDGNHLYNQESASFCRLAVSD